MVYLCLSICILVNFTKIWPGKDKREVFLSPFAERIKMLPAQFLKQQLYLLTKISFIIKKVKDLQLLVVLTWNLFLCLLLLVSQYQWYQPVPSGSCQHPWNLIWYKWSVLASENISSLAVQHDYFRDPTLYSTCIRNNTPRHEMGIMHSCLTQTRFSSRLVPTRLVSTRN